MQKEYLTVHDLSELHNTCMRNIRKIIKQIEPSTTAQLLYKDELNQWRVHHLLSSKFKPKNVKKEKYYTLSIDPCHPYTSDDIEKIMEFVFNQMNDSGLEINYTIEEKKANGQNHLHCYVRCSNKKKLIETLKLGFSTISYNEGVVYDLAGWMAYITKENNNIITLKKTN